MLPLPDRRWAAAMMCSGAREEDSARNHSGSRPSRVWLTRNRSTPSRSVLPREIPRRASRKTDYRPVSIERRQTEHRGDKPIPVPYPRPPSCSATALASPSIWSATCRRYVEIAGSRSARRRNSITVSRKNIRCWSSTSGQVLSTIPHVRSPGYLPVPPPSNGGITYAALCGGLSHCRGLTGPAIVRIYNRRSNHRRFQQLGSEYGRSSGHSVSWVTRSEAGPTTSTLAAP